MADRCTLAIHKLDDFKAWLDRNGVEHRPTNAAYQVLQIRLPGDPRWHALFKRLDATVHLSVPEPLRHLVRRFVRGQVPKDPHQVRAAEIFGVPEDQVTPDMRRLGKTANYVKHYSAPVPLISMNRCCEKAVPLGKATCPDCEEASAGYQAGMTDQTPPWE
jgi:hypothetical protein